MKALKPGEKPSLPGIEKYDDPDIRQVPTYQTSGGTSASQAPRAHNSVNAMFRRQSKMKLSILLNRRRQPRASFLATATGRRLLFVEPRVFCYADALENLRSKAGPVVTVIDLSHDAERAFTVAEEIKFKLSNVHLVMTSPDNNPQTILRAMRSGAEEYLTQPFNGPEVLKSLRFDPKKLTFIPHARLNGENHCHLFQ